MRELLYEAAKHYRRGKALAERGDAEDAAVAFEEALRELHAVRPQRMRDVLLAQVYLSRHQLSPDEADAAADLRLGYAYARTTGEPNVRALAERLWREAVAAGRHRAPAHGQATARKPSGSPNGNVGSDARDQGRRQEGGRRERRGRRAGKGGRGARPPMGDPGLD